MGAFDRIFAAADALAVTEFHEQEAERLFLDCDSAMDRFHAAVAAARGANSPAGKAAAAVDLLAAAEALASAFRAVESGFAALVKDVEARSAALKREMVPLAAEGDIPGARSGLAARYVAGSRRVAIDDVDAARAETPAEFWRPQPSEPDKKALRKAIDAGARWETVRLETGEPGLSLVKMRARKPQGTTDVQNHDEGGESDG